MKRAGFSLLEVLIALAIFGIAAAGVLAALGNHLKNTTFMNDHARAVRIASREMDSLRRAPAGSSVFAESEITGSEDEFVWTAQITTDGLEEWPGIADASGTPMLLTVTVEWNGGRVRLDGFEVFNAE